MEARSSTVGQVLAEMDEGILAYTAGTPEMAASWPNFQVGDLVLMADKNIPRGQWPKALVEQVFPDSEGIVRQVVVPNRRWSLPPRHMKAVYVGRAVA